MIDSVNNINFKAIYTPKKSKLTNIQKDIIEDIKIKLGEQKDKDNFLVKPINNDKVKLSIVDNIKVQKQKSKEKIVYTNIKYIGTYDKKNPFNIKDYKKVIKNEIETFFGAVALGLLGIVMLVGGFFHSINKNDAMKPQMENVIKNTKDSVKNIAKDTIKMYKK